MKHLLLGLALALSPLAITSLIPINHAVAAEAATSLGDLGSLPAIASETLLLAKAGDLSGAQKRITEFETAWDQSQDKLRPNDVAAWTKIDHAADGAIEALRSNPASAADAVPAIEQLVAVLGVPAATTGSTSVAAPAQAFALTNSDGSPVPCEVALGEVRRVAAAKTLAGDDKAKFEELQTKGIERCNADDDKRADGFFGEALTILNK